MPGRRQLRPRQRPHHAAGSSCSSPPAHRSGPANRPAVFNGK
jgi:hypothetical protein